MSLLEYHKSINAELVCMRNRVRDLLHPGRHWGEDGSHKEAILQQVLRRHIPDSINLSSGFVRLKNSSTSQIDLMVTNTTGPILFRENNFQIVTPNVVEAIIEVKTKVTLKELHKALEKLADNVSKVRHEILTNQWLRMNGPGRSTHPWAGLFVFEECDLDPQKVVDTLRDIAGAQLMRSIQAVCLGPNVFVRLWTQAPEATNETFHPSWHCYELKDLAFSYFLGNAVWRHEDGSPEQEHWFPLEEGKEVHLLKRATMNPPYR